MIHLANILIAADDPAVAQDLLQKIRRHGYDGRSVASYEAALATAQQEHPDIVLTTETLAGGSALALAKALKAQPECSEIPLCLAASERSIDTKSEALAAGFDDVLSAPIAETKLVARLRPLVRLAVMRGELHQRVKTARRFGIEVNDMLVQRDVPKDYPVLVVGPNAQSIAPQLPDAALSFAADPYLADDLLGRNNFDAAILLPDDNPQPYLDLCAQARNNPKLFNLPVIILTRPDLIGEDVAYHHGASGFMTTPLDYRELQISVLAMVRRQQLRWKIRDALNQTLQGSTRDAGTNLFSRAFLDAYLADRVDFSVAHGRHLSIMFFALPDIEGVRVRFGEDQANHLRLQATQWITGLLRGEDVTARFGQNEFCVVLPDTPREEAEVVMNRIAGVLAYTDFAVKDVYQPVKIWARVGAADLHPGDTADALVARAREHMA
jgi:two-component system cell cycle response regulator